MQEMTHYIVINLFFQKCNDIKKLFFPGIPLFRIYYSIFVFLENRWTRKKGIKRNGFAEWMVFEKVFFLQQCPTSASHGAF